MSLKETYAGSQPSRGRPDAGRFRAFENLSALEERAHEAFRNPNGAAWCQLQRVLLALNRRLLGTGAAASSSQYAIEWRARNVIERVEQQYLCPDKVPRHLTRVDRTEWEDFVCWLRERVDAHRVNAHPLLGYMSRDGVTASDWRCFLSNCRFSVETFGLHVAAHERLAPAGALRRDESYLDEQALEGGAPSIEALEALERLPCEMLAAEEVHVLNTTLRLCWYPDGLHLGLGGLGAVKLASLLWQKRLLASMRHFGPPAEFAQFFLGYYGVETDDGDRWLSEGAPYTTEEHQFQRVFQGAIRMLDAWARLCDGLLRTLVERRLEGR